MFTGQQNGILAQLGEHLPYKQRVRIPLSLLEACKSFLAGFLFKADEV